MIRFPWKVNDSPSKTEGERGRYLQAMTCSSFFDGQVVRNLCPKDRLTTSKTVMCVRGASLNGEISRVIVKP